MRIACLVTPAVLAVIVACAAAVAEPKPGGRPSPGPYKQIAVTLPKPLDDQSLAAFRKDLGEIVKRKDRVALASKIVSKGFFWQREDSNGADPNKSGIDNFAEAIGLDSSDGSGWQALEVYIHDPTAAPLLEIKHVVCSPASPSFDEAELEKVAEATKTDATDWSYPTAPGVEVRAKPNSAAPVVEKLGLYMVRLLPDSDPNAAVEWLKITTASGKIGYVPASTLAPLGSDQICYTQESGSWRIAGIIGGGGGAE